MREFYKVGPGPGNRLREGYGGQEAGRYVRNLDRFAEARLEDFAIAAAERQASAGAKKHDVFAVERRLHLLDPIDVDDRRAMDPHELQRVELGFEVTHCVANEMLLRADVHAHVVALRLAPIDVGHPDEVNASARFDHQAVRTRVAPIGQRWLGRFRTFPAL